MCQSYSKPNVGRILRHGAYSVDMRIKKKRKKSDANAIRLTGRPLRTLAD